MHPKTEVHSPDLSGDLGAIGSVHYTGSTGSPHTASWSAVDGLNRAMWLLQVINVNACCIRRAEICSTPSKGCSNLRIISTAPVTAIAHSTKVKAEMKLQSTILLCFHPGRSPSQSAPDLPRRNASPSFERMIESRIFRISQEPRDLLKRGVLVSKVAKRKPVP